MFRFNGLRPTQPIKIQTLIFSCVVLKLTKYVVLYRRKFGREYGLPLQDGDFHSKTGVIQYSLFVPFEIFSRLFSCKGSRFRDVMFKKMQSIKMYRAFIKSGRSGLELLQVT